MPYDYVLLVALLVHVVASIVTGYIAHCAKREGMLHFAISLFCSPFVSFVHIALTDLAELRVVMQALNARCAQNTAPTQTRSATGMMPAQRIDALPL